MALMPERGTGSLSDGRCDLDAAAALRRSRSSVTGQVAPLATLPESRAPGIEAGREEAWQ